MVDDAWRWRWDVRWPDYADVGSVRAGQQCAHCGRVRLCKMATSYGIFKAVSVGDGVAAGWVCAECANLSVGVGFDSSGYPLIRDLYVTNGIGPITCRLPHKAEFATVCYRLFGCGPVREGLVVFGSFSFALFRSVASNAARQVWGNRFLHNKRAYRDVVRRLEAGASGVRYDSRGASRWLVRPYRRDKLACIPRVGLGAYVEFGRVIGHE